MNRRSFLKWFGFGAAAVAVPAIAKSEKSGMALLHATSPTIGEGRGLVVGYEIWGDDTRLLYASDVYMPLDHYDEALGNGWTFDVPDSWRGMMWTKEERDAMRLQERPPLVFNKI